MMSETDKLLFDIRRSVRYHERRRAFFDNMNGFTTFIILVSGSATFTGVVSSFSYKDTLIMIMSAIVAVFSFIEVVIRSSQSARLYNDLANAFIRLEKKIIARPGEKELSGFQQERLEIETNEPPIYRVLDILCHNAQARSMGYDESDQVIWKVGPLQRCFSNIFRMAATADKIEKVVT